MIKPEELKGHLYAINGVQANIEFLEARLDMVATTNSATWTTIVGAMPCVKIDVKPKGWWNKLLVKVGLSRYCTQWVFIFIFTQDRDKDVK